MTTHDKNSPTTTAAHRVTVKMTAGTRELLKGEGKRTGMFEGAIAGRMLAWVLQQPALLKSLALGHVSDPTREDALRNIARRFEIEADIAASGRFLQFIFAEKTAYGVFLANGSLADAEGRPASVLIDRAAGRVTISQYSKDLEAEIERATKAIEGVEGTGAAE